MLDTHKWSKGKTIEEVAQAILDIAVEKDLGPDSYHRVTMPAPEFLWVALLGKWVDITEKDVEVLRQALRILADRRSFRSARYDPEVSDTALILMPLIMVDLSKEVAGEDF